MMIDIQYRELRIDTYTGNQARYQFGPGVNLIIGPFSSGKTTILELLKYALGGNAELSHVVQEEVAAVTASCTIGGSDRRLRREIGSRFVHVYDSEGHSEAELHTSAAGKRPRPARWLLEAAGLPVIHRRRAKNRVSSTSELVSFFDFYAYAYISQREIDRSVVGHRDSNIDRKRRATMEVMLGLVDDRLAELERQESQLEEAIQEMKQELSAIRQFLENAETPDKEVLISQLEQAESEEQEARDRLAQLRESVSEALGQEARRRRSHAELRGAVDNAQKREAELQSQIEERKKRRSQVSLELDRLGRTASANESLSGIDYSRCPRCLQQLERDAWETDTCYVCKQEEPSEAMQGAEDVSMERKRLQALLEDVEQELSEDEEALRLTRHEVRALEREIQKVESDLLAAEREYVGPYFEDISRTSVEAERARSRIDRIRDSLYFWENYESMQGNLQKLESGRNKLSSEIEERSAHLEARRQLLAELSVIFKEVIEQAELPWYESAWIDTRTYLPIINGASFDALSSGGMKTVVNVSYHLALLTLGLVHNDLMTPNLLIVDSPAKNLGVSRNDRAQADRLYRRIRALSDAFPESFQVIVADNDEPGVRMRLANQINVSYSSPSVPGVSHPGPEAVEHIGEEGE